MASKLLISSCQYLIYAFSRLLMLFIRWEAQGELKIEKGRTYVIAANHVDSRDPFFIMSAMPLAKARELFPVRFMTYAGYYFTLGRPFEFAAGCFPTKSKNPRVPAGVDGAAKLLKEGNSVLIFPEGKRTSEGNERAHTGLERILAQSNEDVGLVLARVSWEGKRSLRIVYADGEKLKNKTSQEILDAIYQIQI